jgi:hypothetical protein
MPLPSAWRIDRQAASKGFVFLWKKWSDVLISFALGGRTARLVPYGAGL